MSEGAQTSGNARATAVHETAQASRRRPSARLRPANTTPEPPPPSPPKNKQTMMEMMAERFPGCFSGYSLAVAESHQRTKVDTSGTAKAVVASLNMMGLQFGEVRRRLLLGAALHAGCPLLCALHAFGSRRMDRSGKMAACPH